jgi:hypothetical protein
MSLLFMLLVLGSPAAPQALDLHQSAESQQVEPDRRRQRRLRRPEPAPRMSTPPFCEQSAAWEQARWGRTLTDRSRWSAANTWRRPIAEDLAAMANGGDCPGAIRRATQLGEFEMADTLRRACTRDRGARVTVTEPRAD